MIWTYIVNLRQKQPVFSPFLSFGSCQRVTQFKFGDYFENPKGNTLVSKGKLNQKLLA